MAKNIVAIEKNRVAMLNNHVAKQKNIVAIGKNHVAKQKNHVAIEKNHVAMLNIIDAMRASTSAKLIVTYRNAVDLRV